MLTGLRRGELFALRWKAMNLANGHLTVQEAVYEGVFGTPKTDAGIRRVPLSEAPVALLDEWRHHAKRTEPDALVFSTWSGKAISPITSRGARSFQRALGWGSKRDVADLPPHLCVVVARQRGAGQGGCETDGAYERRRHAERLHAGAGRSLRTAVDRVGSEFSRLFTNRNQGPS